MFQRVLVASDLTPQSALALRAARDLGQAFAAQLVVAHVVAMPPVLRRWSGPAFDGDLKAYQALLERQAAAAKVALERQMEAAGLGPSAARRAVIRTGDPAPTLARLVDELDADLVIVARGRGGQLGPIAERLVRLVGRMVLVAPVRGKRAAKLDLPAAARPSRRGQRAAA